MIDQPVFGLKACLSCVFFTWNAIFTADHLDNGSNDEHTSSAQERLLPIEMGEKKSIRP